MIHRETITPDRLIAFLNGVFAVIVTVIMLELRARKRFLLVLAGLFSTSMLVSLWAPLLGVGLICAALIPHLQPDAAASQIDDDVPTGSEQQTRTFPPAG